MPVDGFAVVVREQAAPLSVERVTFSDAGKGEVRVKVQAVGVCQSDASFYNGKLPTQLPLVLGHEGSGVVEQVGEEVDDLEVGDHVVFSMVAPCGKCRFCAVGRQTLCKAYAPLVNRKQSNFCGNFPVTDGEGKPLKVMVGLGCMAEYCVVSRANLIKLRPEMPLAKAALVGCATVTGYGAVINRAKVEVGSSCVCVGCGGVGLNVIQSCRLAGATQIVAVDMEPSKLEAAKLFGATHVVNAREVKDVAKAVKKLTGGGADYGFESVGRPETYAQVFDSVGTGGTAVMVGVTKYTDKTSIRTWPLLNDEKTLTGSYFGSCRPSIDMPRICELYSQNKLMLDELVSRYYDITEAQQAFDDLSSGNVNLRGVIAMNELASLATQAKM